MSMQSTSTQFLHFAYLIEIAVVFNLAFFEFILKRDLKKLKERMRKLESATYGPNEDSDSDSDSVCNDRIHKICGKCIMDLILKKFEKLDKVYIEKAVKGILSYGDAKAEKMNLKEAWKMSESRWAWLLSPFHRKVVLNSVDRLITLFILAFVTITLCVITLVDMNILIIHTNSGFSVGVWNIFLFVVLVISIFSPVLFWWLWGHLLREFECLTRLHKNALYAKTMADNRKVEKLLGDLLQGFEKSKEREKKGSEDKDPPEKN